MKDLSKKRKININESYEKIFKFLIRKNNRMRHIKHRITVFIYNLEC